MKQLNKLQLFGVGLFVNVAAFFITWAFLFLSGVSLGINTAFGLIMLIPLFVIEMIAVGKVAEWAVVWYQERNEEK